MKYTKEVHRRIKVRKQILMKFLMMSKKIKHQTKRLKTTQPPLIHVTYTSGKSQRGISHRVNEIESEFTL